MPRDTKRRKPANSSAAASTAQDPTLDPYPDFTPEEVEKACYYIRWSEHPKVAAALNNLACLLKSLAFDAETFLLDESHAVEIHMLKNRPAPNSGRLAIARVSLNEERGRKENIKTFIPDIHPFLASLSGCLAEMYSMQEFTSVISELYKPASLGLVLSFIMHNGNVFLNMRITNTDPSYRVPVLVSESDDPPPANLNRLRAGG